MEVHPPRRLQGACSVCSTSRARAVGSCSRGRAPTRRWALTVARQFEAMRSLTAGSLLFDDLTAWSSSACSRSRSSRPPLSPGFGQDFLGNGGPMFQKNLRKLPSSPLQLHQQAHAEGRRCSSSSLVRESADTASLRVCALGRARIPSEAVRSSKSPRREKGVELTSPSSFLELGGEAKLCPLREEQRKCPPTGSGFTFSLWGRYATWGSEGAGPSKVSTQWSPGGTRKNGRAPFHASCSSAGAMKSARQVSRGIELHLAIRHKVVLVEAEGLDGSLLQRP